MIVRNDELAFIYLWMIFRKNANGSLLVLYEPSTGYFQKNPYQIK